jgi:N-formylglutamate amidohydrolase
MGGMDVPIAAAPPFRLVLPPAPAVPLVFASPHSGRDYLPNFLADSRLDPLGLRRSEDSFVDELFAAAPEHGAPLLAATFPRSFCDPNREPWELDPAMFEEDLPGFVNTSSTRVAAGLGTIPRIVASGEPIYRRKLRFAEAEARVRHYWQPYHARLAQLVDDARRQFGACLLIDCHSMPGTGAGGRADFVLGDAHGTSCAPRLTRLAERALAELGYSVRRNDPYSGGYTTRHYGRPREGLNALQVEVARGLYMDEARIERLPRFATLQSAIARFIGELARGAALLAG